MSMNVVQHQFIYHLYSAIDEATTSEQNSIKTVSTTVREHMRILNTQRDSDRVYLEHNMQRMLISSFFSY